MKIDAGPTDYRTVVRQTRALGTAERAAGSMRYFKTGPGEYGEGDRFLGLTAPMLHSLARRHQSLRLGDVQRLLKSQWHEERLLALLILVRQYGRGSDAERSAIYRLYLQHTAFINNWDLVDCSAEHIVGAHLYERSRAPLLRLAKSKNLWNRRIAVLATRYFIKHGEYDETLRLARGLLADEQDLIHKAVGWLLREIGDRDRAVEEGFLDRHAGQMPRTMLRYAIEKFPPLLRRRYMRAGNDADDTDKKV